MIIEQARNRREQIVNLLSAEKLPVSDLPETLDNFIVALENGQVIGAIALETYGNYGLLRSLAITPEYRKIGIAGQLIKYLESLAATSNIKALYLLTETAPAYFEGKGFQRIERNEVPGEIRQSSEFSHVCPVSAIVMKKSIH